MQMADLGPSSRLIFYSGTFEVMGIPAWVSRLMIIVLGIGFPIAVVLAWAFDITEEGIVRSEGRATGKPGTSNKALVAVNILAIAFGIWGRWGSSGGDGGGLIRTIAVLPLDNLSGDPQQDYFVNGMHDALISELSKISALTVRSRQSTLQYRNSDKTMPEIAAELRVDALVEGSVMLLGNPSISLHSWSTAKTNICGPIILTGIWRT